ncbi:tRNA (adenine-N(1)-)-methyltransferase catalytic subunit trm61 [Clonorchis sinensis]|uniref:tRNA (adenine(58)-N(1))-methyltransferase catalytic subunit TRMT61A n=1 Tax=Clonorchis sinensis TaxID=79923 RepID=A0A3R7JP15_CLOSI|nr:tRNA (adenine-N(1)-)-methyltransferase catalytic subunit trm61 [Clonorchis sinensis]
MGPNNAVCPFQKHTASLGDCVLVVTGKLETRAILLQKDAVTQTRYGALRHNDCVGKCYGSKIPTSLGHVHILSLDPILWSASLPHRTQIIYPPDASLIVGGLDLVPGCRVLESGTGSGSLTHFLAQAVWPTGSVVTFDFHAGRVECARDEFKNHGLCDCIKVVHRDVCTEGFPPVGHQDNVAGVNAVMLDLPQPWLVVPSLPAVFQPDSGGRVCSFSPCIEQVQRTCAALQKAGFSQIQTSECLQRTFDVSRAFLNVPNMGQVGIRERLDNQTLVSGPPSESNEPWWTKRHLLPPPCGLNRRRSFSAVEQDGPMEDTISEETSASKRPKCTRPPPARRDESRFSWEAVPQAMMAGHTGYLTFASWIPRNGPSGDTASELKHQPIGTSSVGPAL